MNSLEKQKTIVYETLIIKGIALCGLCKHTKSEPTDDIINKIHEIYAQLSLFTKDYTDNKVVPFIVKHSLVLGHYGRYVKALLKSCDDGIASAAPGPNGANDSLNVFKSNSAKVDQKLKEVINLKKMNNFQII